MTRAFRLAISLLALPGCATLTPQRCASIDTAARTVEQIAAILIAKGVEPVKAAKLADAVKAGQIAMQVACQSANPGIGPH
jgi:hypothetical protein